MREKRTIKRNTVDQNRGKVKLIVVYGLYEILDELALESIERSD